MKQYVLFFAFVAVASSAGLYRTEWDNDWKAFKGSYSKSFRSMKEESRRRLIWEAKRTLIEKHNEEAKLGKHTYTLAVNQFTDMADEEMSALTKTILPGKLRSGVPTVTLSNSIPTSVDLRNGRCMPPIKDQGGCGSCWAFAANTPFEYAVCKKTGKLHLLSEQQLVDCSTSYGNGGCSGGWYETAWRYVMDAKGQMNSTTYPYTQRDEKCKYCASKAVATISSSARIRPGDTASMQAAVANGSLVAVAFQAMNFFGSYGGGVYNDPECPKDGGTVNHAVVIVGYGTQNGIPYWIVRNSWGASWGLNGYFLIERGTNMCNIETWAAILTV